MNNQVNSLNESKNVNLDLNQKIQVCHSVTNGHQITPLINLEDQSVSKIEFSSSEIFQEISKVNNNSALDQLQVVALFDFTHSSDTAEKVNDCAEDFFNQSFDFEDKYNTSSEVKKMHSLQVQVTTTLIQQSQFLHTEGSELQQISSEGKERVLTDFINKVDGILQHLDIICKDGSFLRGNLELLASHENVSDEELSTFVEQITQRAVDEGVLVGANDQPLTLTQVEALKGELKLIFKEYVSYFQAEIRRSSSQEKENKTQEQIKHPQLNKDHKIEHLPVSPLEGGDERYIKVAVKIIISIETIFLKMISEKRQEERQEELEEKKRLIIRKEILISEIKRETINHENLKSHVIKSEARRVERAVTHQAVII